MTKTLFSQIERAVEKQDSETVTKLLGKENFHTVSDLINAVSTGKFFVFSALSPELQVKVILTLNKRSKRTIIPKLTDEIISNLLKISDDDDAADILEFVDDKRREAILKSQQEDKRNHIATLLKYHPETAGGIMNLNYIVVKHDFTLKDVADKVERYSVREKKSPVIVTTKDDGSVVGYVPYRKLILAKPESTVREVTRSLPLLSAKTGKKTIVNIINTGTSDVVGVVDGEKQLLGIIYLTDAVRLIEKETTADLFAFAGVSREEDMLDPARIAVRYRYKWLIVNLATAFLAAFVVSLFESTIAQMAILASFMPIVAGMGGNAGTQSLAVVVRGIALGELEWVSGRRVIAKEFAAGFTNGVIVALVTVPFSYLIGKNFLLSLVLGSAMIINLTVAGLFGALIPLTLRLFKIDPAIASSVFVTTATDVCGFFAFLGLATIVLL
jgi:magnesium transporter